MNARGPPVAGRGRKRGGGIGPDGKRDGYLDRVLVGGREPATIRIVDHDRRWPLRLRDTAQRIRRVLGDRADSIEHIGSTAVPGLAAKPIIDVLLTVEDVDDEAAYLPPLESSGLRLRVREPTHRMLRTPERDVHLHVYQPDRPEVRDYLDLRDWLRVDARDRERYAAEKRALAQRAWNDMNQYAEAKSAVITEILGRARAWRAGGQRDDASVR